MSKVVLTQKQADALEHLKDKDWSKEKIIQTHVKNGFDWGDDVKSLSELSTDELVLAVVIGYEVEPTPEEKLLELFNKCSTLGVPAYTNGIRDTLNTLGIKIDGINGNPNE